MEIVRTSGTFNQSVIIENIFSCADLASTVLVHMVVLI